MGDRARSRLATLLLLACTAAPVSAKAPAGALTATERKLVQRIDHRLPESLALLERAVNINSGTSNVAGVREVSKLFAAELDAMGFETRWVDGAGFGRAGHLIAERSRQAKPGSPKIVFVGHLDTVFEPDSPFQRFRRLDDSTATGPGVIDMKGGDVIALLALRALHDTGELDHLRVTLVMTGDEESPGRPIAAARAALVDAARGADAAIGFEDGDGEPQHVIVSRRGSSNWTLHVHGTPSHSSQVFTADVGIGAIYEAARILDRFRDTLQVEPYLTFSPGIVLGGTAITLDSTGARGTAFGKTNVVAETTVVTGDLRAITLEQRERAHAAMQGIVTQGSPRTSARLEFDDDYPPLAPSDGNRRLLAIVDRASRDLGFGALSAVDPARAGAADVSFLAGTVPMVIDAMGLKGSGGHTVQETAHLGALPVQAKRVAVTLSRLAHAAPAAPKP